MMTLNDGRAELWQWDTGRTLNVDADCSQVHFSNKVFGRSIDVDVVGGTAIIPDVLLQTDKDLNIWAFVGTAENGYTKISKTFKVNRRNKPADYVFTPVEQMTIAEIAAIAQSVRDDADNGLFDGAQGPIGPQGPKGDPGANGKDAVVDSTLTQSGQAADAAAVGDQLSALSDETSELKGDLVLLSETSDGIYRFNPTLVDGYVDASTGSVSNWGGTSTSVYKRTDYIELSPIVKSISFQALGDGSVNAHYASAMYDGDKNYIEGTLITTNTKKWDTIPSDAKFIVISTINIVGDVPVDFKISRILDDIDTRVKTLEDRASKEEKRIIACFGDSTIEGMNMASAGIAEYGGDNMPSHLLTLLTDNNYNIDVENYGHGGERSAETCMRIGAKAVYLNEDIVIPSDNPMVSLGAASVTSYKVSGSKMESTCKNYDGTNAQILFTQTSRNTRPLMFGSYLCNLYQLESGGTTTQYVQLAKSEGKDIVIPKYSLITNGNTIRGSVINIVHMGINDGSNMTLDEWIRRCKSAIDYNPKTIICGLYNKAWEFWKDATGTKNEKYEKYLQKCLSELGTNFVDLYQVFCTERCIDIAKKGGYLADRTQAQIDADNLAFANGHTCPSLTENGVEASVHFNSIGYYVFAKVLYDKITQIKWI